MENNSVFSQGLKTGVIAAVAAIVITLLAYVANINMMGWTFQGVSYLVLIAVMIYGLLAFRKANGGYMAFAQGILMVLVAGIVCSVISYFFNLLYYNVINPNAVAEIVEYSKSAVEKMGMAMTDELEEQIRTNAQASTQFSGKLFAFTIIGSVVVWSILGAILGAIFSKKNPEDAI